CYYCACNKIVTKKRDKALPYLERVHREIAQQSALFGGEQRPVEQLHWGGGTPTFISSEQMDELFQQLRQHFRLRDDDRGDYSIEIDPREVHSDTLATLRRLGFNRISLGVQDFDPKVQKAVNRIQSESLTRGVLDDARALGFRSINLDLIYGLPFQTIASFDRTLDSVLAMAPDRLSVFNYAHLPDRFSPQQRIRAEDLPSPQDKLQILHNTVQRLTDAGYVYIGMDHFARADDSLARAQHEGRLHRNFQGYTTHGDCDLIGIGVSSIGQTEHAYFQNHHEQGAYDQALDQGQLPLKRGLALTKDDRLRRWVILQLICQFSLDKQEFAKAWGESFDDYFVEQATWLKRMQHDGLLMQTQDHLQVLPAGRLLIRAICQLFDRYLPSVNHRTYSRII
ncbi:MAG: oxygen-independent coproporphyrinogen III oxidase, partial [Gammaproteobacteria bacterium]|nr:oxygen-independent coproporphyrinogen III oxidase [Gammaproteobacteria bacterium]